MLRAATFSLVLGVAGVVGSAALLPTGAQAQYASMSEQELADTIATTCSEGGGDCLALIQAISAQVPASVVQAAVTAAMDAAPGAAANIQAAATTAGVGTTTTTTSPQTQTTTDPDGTTGNSGAVEPGDDDEASGS